MKKILIADDDKSIRFLLEFNFSEEGFDVITVEDGLMAYQLAKTNSFDAIILDLMMPGLTGIEVSKKLRDKEIYTPILILTAKDDSKTMISGLENGADDYMYKPFSTEEILARIKTLIRRNEKYKKEASDILNIGEISIDFLQKTVSKNGSDITLTKREFELLSHLAQHKDMPVSRAQILQKFWGDSNELEFTRIVEVHISKLREKIEEDAKNPQYIKTKRGFGYIFKDPSQ